MFPISRRHYLNFHLIQSCLVDSAKSRLEAASQAVIQFVLGTNVDLAGGLNGHVCAAAADVVLDVWNL